MIAVALLQLACGGTGEGLADGATADSAWSAIDAVSSDGPVDAWPWAARCAEGTLVLPHLFVSLETLARVSDMTFDVDHAYLAIEYLDSSAGEVLRVPSAGGASEIVADMNPAASHLAVDDTDLYMIAGSTLWQMPKTGGDLLRRTTNERRPMGLVVDEQYVYIGAIPGLKLWRFDKTDWSETVLAQTGPNINAMVATQTDIYWSTAIGDIERVPKDGSPPTILARHQDKVTRLAVGTEGVYYTDWGSWSIPQYFHAVRFVPAAGAAPDVAYSGLASFATNAPSLMKTGFEVLQIDPFTNSYAVAYVPGVTFHFLFDEPDDAFLAYGGDREVFGPGRVYHYRKSTDQLTMLAENQYYPRAVHADDAHVYFLNVGDAGFANGTVSRVPRGGGPVEDLVVGMSQPTSMVLYGDRVYWINSEDGSLASVAKTGGPPTLVSAGHSWPHSLILNAGALFWANFDGRIMKYPLPAGPEQEIAVDQAGPDHLFVDSGRIYWANQKRVGAHPFSLLSMSSSGGDIRVLTESGDDWWIGAAVVVSGYMYYTLLGYLNGVYRVPVTGRGPETIEMGDTLPSGIALGEQYVYWTNDHVLKRQSRAGGPVEILTTADTVSNLWYASGILYWRSPGGMFCAPVD